MEFKDQNVCIYCGKPLNKWENTRSYCWNCTELTTESFGEEMEHHEEVNSFKKVTGFEDVNGTEEILLLLD